MATRTPRGKGKTFAEEFGERLRSARERRGLTQEQLAEMVGITASRESEYESGRFAPQLEKAAKLAVALEVTLDALVGRDTPEVAEDIRDPKLRASVRALEATANGRYLDAASLAIEGFASLARHDEFEARRPRRKKT
jgi:transcriptional regulator with XRE-family HTH domain